MDLSFRSNALYRDIWKALAFGWEAHINEILSDFGFKSTTHERCIYKATIDGEAVLFLRQVDNFAVACKKPAISKMIIAKIGAKLSVPLHQLGVIEKFNGIDVVQSKSFIKISCTSYLDKVLDGHNLQETKSTPNPIPMQSDSTSQGMLESADLPSSSMEIKRLHDAHFNYRQVIGEAMYAMVTCQPNISYAVIKVSQYSSNPAEVHYKAARQLMNYLALTKSRGITYWRGAFVPADLPEHQPDQRVSRSEVINSIPEPDKPREPHAYMDSDWGGDRSHRRSVTGLLVLLSGGAIIAFNRIQAIRNLD